MIFPKNLTSMLTRVQNLTTMLVTTVLHRTVHGAGNSDGLANVFLAIFIVRTCGTPL